MPLITSGASITIRCQAGELWDYAWDPEHWTASNPEEHFGLTFDTPDNRPRTNATFEQRESVAGVYADLRGHFPLVDRPRMVVWAGVATYRLLGGLFRPRIPEGGVIRVEELDDGVKVSHDVYMHFADTIIGRLLARAFRRRDGEGALARHNDRELAFFKRQLEGGAPD